MKDMLDYSVVMLVEDNVDFTGYLQGLHSQLNLLGRSHELVLAINGSNDYARRCLDDWPDDGPEVSVIETNRRVYSGTCLHAVMDKCHGKIFIICGPYQQFAIEGLEDLLIEIESGKADLVLPWRQNRVDPAINQFQSRLFNWFVHRMTGVRIQDLNSSLRIVRRSLLEETSFHGDLYRFLPLLAQKRGFRVSEVPAVHVQEMGKVGYFGLQVYINRLIDLLTIHFNLNFARKPLRYFGFRGVIIAFAGLLSVMGALLFKLAGVDALGNSPLLMVGLALILTGSGLWGVGLLGEILAFTYGRKKKEYVVEKII